MSALLQINALVKTFGGVAATDKVDLAVTKGELHAIIGPNGAGKTTLISQLSGTLIPDSGTILLNGKNITKKPAYTRARLGIARSYQITSLVMEMTVRQNVALAVQSKEGHAFRFIRAADKIAHLQNAALEALRDVGLDVRADDLTTELSHGEHRLLEIAIALATGAELLLLDEPMAGLGPEESAKMVTFLKELKGTRTILLIEHDMDAVFALADRISVLVYGRIIATGTPTEIRADASVRHAYLGEG
ncbi:MAG: ABC transporter ATP-binding protein [Alphaproteobacteria bacterium]|nr:ABC transporter ATP-binding protein [Alphaproteobacteria bacterium]